VGRAHHRAVHEAAGNSPAPRRPAHRHPTDDIPAPDNMQPPEPAGRWSPPGLLPLARHGWSAQPGPRARWQRRDAAADQPLGLPPAWPDPRAKPPSRAR